MDALELRMYDTKIEEVRQQALFQGYVEGKRVVKTWAKNCARHSREDLEQ